MTDSRDLGLLRKVLLEETCPGDRACLTAGWTVTRLASVPQDPFWHPEGNVLLHTQQVVDRAAKLRNQVPKEDRFIYMFSALLHDVGKWTHTFYRSNTGKKLTSWTEKRPADTRIVAYGHDTAGPEIARKFLEGVTNDQEILLRVPRMVEFHMKPFQLEKAGPKAFKKLKTKGAELYLIGMLSWADKGEKPDYWFERIKELA